MNSRVNVPERVLREEQEALASRDQILRRDGQPAPTAPQEPAQPTEPQPEPKQQQPEQAEPTAPATSEPKPAPAKDDAATLKTQLDALKADFQRQFGKIGDEVQKWRDRVGQLMDENADLAAKLAEKPAATTEAQPGASMAGDHSRYLTDAEKGEIGSDLTAIVAKIAKAVTEDALKPYASLPEQVQHVQAHNIAVSFVDAVDRLAPGFREANGNPDLEIPPKDADWIAYLQTPDSIRGVPMAQIIGELEGNQRVIAAANLFKAYAQLRASNAAPANGTRPALADQAAPARRTAGAGQPTTQQRGPKRYTMQEFDAGMSEAKRLGLSTVEGGRMYRELAQASREGRVIA